MDYTCAVCETPFVAVRRRRAAPTCSDKCRWTMERRKAGRAERREYERTGMKTCPDCGVSKPLSDYTVRKDRDTPVAYCKPCNATRRREHYRSDEGRIAYYAAKYGVTAEWVTETLKRQGGACAICYDEVPLHLDHDHATGQARAFLCRPCNQGLGQFMDSTERLKAAVNYLQGATVRA